MTATSLPAKEAAQLQLSGTELVVLSACDTAAGSQQSGEGLYGLQRALNVAGALNTLVSLWKVDDGATAGFMQRYYQQLKQGKGRRDALLAVQQEFRTKPRLAECSPCPGSEAPQAWPALVNPSAGGRPHQWRETPRRFPPHRGGGFWPGASRPV